MQSNSNSFYFRTVRRWQTLFALCLGLFVSAAFVMKWIETDLLYQGKLVSILGLEFSYSKETIETIFGGITPDVRRLLSYHLYFDFIFMTGCFPGIAALCMIAFYRTDRKIWKQLLLMMAFLQLIAWACDITENIILLKWLKETSVRDSIVVFRVLVFIKWIIAVAGFLTAVIFLIVTRRKVRKERLQ